MSLYPLSEINERDYGDEIWYGGDDCGMIQVGEWSAGGCKSNNPEDWSDLKKQALVIYESQSLLESLEELSCLFAPCERESNRSLVKAIAVIARAKGVQP